MPTHKVTDQPRSNRPLRSLVRRCPSPKPHPTRSGAPRSVNPSTGPRPRAWLEIERPASLDRRPCTVTRESRGRTGSQGDMAVSAAEEGKQSKQAGQEGEDHRAEILSGSA